MVQEELSSAARRNRKLPIEENSRVVHRALSPNSGTAAFASRSKQYRHGRFQFFNQCISNLVVGRTNNHQRRRSGTFFAVFVRRFVLVAIFLSLYSTIYYRLDEVERKYDIAQDGKFSEQSIALSATGEDHMQSPTTKSNELQSSKIAKTTPLAHYLMNGDIGGASISNNGGETSLQEAKKGREHILSILEDAGIEVTDSRDVLQLPFWSSVSDLYYSNKKSDMDSSTQSLDGPIILGLESCPRFRERVPPKERFLGVAGNFNSGTTAFGIALQKNCRMEDHSGEQNFVMRKRRTVFATNVNGMLSMVPWAKHKTADYRHNNTIHPPISIDHDKVMPVVLVRDPFYWMQSMCKEGYGVRWDHDSKFHCPNLIPNDFDKKRFPKLGNNNQAPVPVWMGANPSVGPSWPSLIHYWNAWYESYYDNINDLIEKKNPSWPRLMIRFEDTLFYPKQVMKQICHCGGGKLLFNNTQPYDYNLEESKPDHKHQQKNNFVTAMIQYGTNSTRLRNMTEMDVAFAMEHLSPTLMQAFGYSYPNKDDKRL